MHRSSQSGLQRLVQTLPFLLLSAILMLVPAAGAWAQRPSPLPIIPGPTQVELREGGYVLGSGTRIFCTARFSNEAQMLVEILPLRTSVRIESDAAGNVSEGIQLRSDEHLSPESYRLTITPVCIRIEAADAAGAMYACQTLRQLLPVSAEQGMRFEALSLPCVRIFDSPRFSWRGAMLDCSRHFRSPAYIRRFLDDMAAHKLNRFHWHLTDDQGWRLEIRSWPLLTTIGAWRTQEDGTLYGGYYTQEEVRDIVAYAASLHIEVIPEIDMPGHIQSALAAYPSLSCYGRPVAVQTKWGIFKDVLCISSDQTYAFIADVLRETATLFPSKWIHIGGDECSTDQWRACPNCSSLLGDVGGDPALLQSLFSSRVIAILDSLGRQPIGWDEILRGRPGRGIVIQAWEALDIAHNAMRNGFATIISDHQRTYLHHTYDVLPLRPVYEFDPFDGCPASFETSLCLGIEANLWAESSPTEEIADYRLFPRLTAFAEVAWSNPALRDWDDFRERLAMFGRRLLDRGISMYQDPEIDWDDGRQLTLDSVSFIAQGILHLHFSEPLDSLSALKPGNYHFAASPFDGPVFLECVSMPDARTIELQFSAPCAHDGLTVTLQGLHTPNHRWNTIADTLSPTGLPRVYLPPRRDRGIALELWPNPCISAHTGQLFVRVRTTQHESLHLRLYDTSGRILLRRDAAGGYPDAWLMTIPVGQLSRGQYFVSVQGSSGTEVRSVVLR